MDHTGLRPLVVGVTGGIASGKSTVCKLFAALGVPVIDADAIARELVQPGSPALAAIVQEFGREILNTDGTLRRDRLRTIIFDDADRRAHLNEILHPPVYEQIRTRIRDLQVPYCIVCVPLLVETGGRAMVQRVLLVDAPEGLQLLRMAARDHVSEERARNALAAQASRQERLAVADDVICNDRDIEHLRSEVERLHQAYLHAAASGFASA